MSCDRNDVHCSRIDLLSATAEDSMFIVEMARHACVIEDRPLPAPDCEETRSLLPGHGDIVLVAVDGTGPRLGAAWTFRNDPPLLVEVNGVSLPEIAMAVAPEFRGRGIGGALLDELVRCCAGVHPALSLNVHQRNPAARLYERKGFRATGQGRGPLGIAMRKDV
jgi:GNAT superfamily N-acetyltransferase